MEFLGQAEDRSRKVYKQAYVKHPWFLSKVVFLEVSRIQWYIAFRGYAGDSRNASYTAYTGMEAGVWTPHAMRRLG